MNRAAHAAHLRMGRRGEKLAARLYAALGCDLLTCNWRTKAGELDLVVRDGDNLVFVEVKSLRRHAGFTPSGNLSRRQAKRNYHAAKLYLRMLDHPRLIGRFALVEVVFNRRGGLAEIRRFDHYLPPLVPGAWR